MRSMFYRTLFKLPGKYDTKNSDLVPLIVINTLIIVYELVLG